MHTAMPYRLLALTAALLLAGCGRGDERVGNTELPAGATRADSMAAGAAIHTPPPLDPATAGGHSAVPGATGGAVAPASSPDQQPQTGPGADTVQTRGTTPRTRP